MTAVRVMIYKPKSKTKSARHAMFRLSPQFLTQFKIRWRCSRRVTGFQHGVTYLLWLIYASTYVSNLAEWRSGSVLGP